ncbi:MAG TPA: Ig-like domain-containing protein, partial [Longimicrobiales bacterium]|nr:Ig-like domain-containing protein [Longimicrobiales bacterium]
GNADNTPMRNVSGVDGAAPIWRDVMETALKGSPPRPFPQPEGIERAVVCLPSGLLPTPYCQRRRLEVFAAGTAPTDRDDYYRPLLVCDATGETVTRGSGSCPGNVNQRVFAFVPLEAIPWARRAGVALPPLPPYVEGSTPGARGSAPLESLRLTSPADGTVLRLSREVLRQDQALRLEALPAGPVRFVEIYVDGALLGRIDRAPYRLTWPIAEGGHEIRARAVDASGNETWSGTSRVTVLPP